MDRLDSIVDTVRARLEAKNAARDKALQASRALIRACANAIRATHRADFSDARALLATAAEEARALTDSLEHYADLYQAGYTQDALKEYAEAQLTYAFVIGGEMPGPDDLGIEPAAYLNGLAEAASELRRHSLDLMRQNRLDRAEQMQAIMDDVYSQLITVDFPDAITGGLRRTTDMLRGVVERTRGDLTTAMRQEIMRQALKDFEARLGLKGSAPEPDASPALDEGEA
jgi:translin